MMIQVVAQPCSVIPPVMQLWLPYPVRHYRLYKTLWHNPGQRYKR